MRASETSPGYEWLYAASCLLFTAGLFLDGWAHNHLASSLETFFTPWHAVFYAGYFVTVFSLLGWMVSRRRRFGSFIDAVPPGHGLSLFGAGVFLVSGLGDMVWHLVFGIEANIEALLSPTHLGLAVGMVLMLSGGLRHFWATRRPGVRRGFWKSFPFVLSATLSLAVILFLMQYGHFTEIMATGLAPKDPSYAQEVSVLGVLVFTGALIGSISTMLRRDRLPFGAVTFVLATLAVGFSLMRFGTEAIPAALFAGIIGDLWLEVGETKVKRMTALRIFCFLLPFAYYAFLLELLSLGQGHLWWAVHMTAGLPVVAGFTGFLVSFIAWPSRQAIERTGE